MELPMDIFFTVWMIVLPIIAITLIVLIPVFWFFIVPKIARVLTWKRFSRVSFHFLGDDSGYAYLLPTKEELPEGVVQTKQGYRFLPRPTTKAGNPGSPDEEFAEALALRKFVWRDMGKPVWFGYAGKVAAMNPATLALLQQSQKPRGDLKARLDNLDGYVKELPKTLTIRTWKRDKTLNLRTDLQNMLKELREGVDFKPLTVLDPTRIKEIFPHMWTPSQLDALATNREMKGLKRAGRQYTPLILGAGLILGLVIIAIILLMTFGK